MAIIALPSTTRFAKAIEWTLDRPAQVNRSAWTGRRQVIASPWHGKWSAKVDLVPIISEANMLAWRAFLAQLKGQLNTFRLPMTEGAQAGGTTGVTTAATAALGATAITLQGPGGTTIPIAQLKPGYFVTINDQPLMIITSVINGASFLNDLTFEPPLRAAAVGGTAAEIANPTCLVALADSAISWGVEPGKIYGIGSLQVEEAF